MSIEAMKQALEALETLDCGDTYKTHNAASALRKALALSESSTKCEETSHAQPKEEPLHPVHIGVDVTREGTAVTAFYRKPDAVMEMFYSQFHPMAQPEQEPVAMRYDFDGYGYKYIDSGSGSDWKMRIKGAEPVYDRPQTRVRLADERIDAARWRFLVDNSFDKEGVTQFHVWEHSWEPHSQTGEPTEWEQRVRGPALDRFIDRAIEKAHDIKE